MEKKSNILDDDRLLQGNCYNHTKIVTNPIILLVSFLFYVLICIYKVRNPNGEAFRNAKNHKRNKQFAREDEIERIASVGG